MGMKIMIGLGTRPEAIKLIPLIFKLRERFDVRVVSSGQHDELLRQVLNFFKINADYSLNCMGNVPDLEKLSVNIITVMGEVMDKENPDLVIVQGDTMTVFQTAFVAFLRQKPLFHLEAGLRTFCRFSPFPEEMLRTLVGNLADFHLSPTGQAKNNLLAEGVRQDRILVTGNTVIDALHIAEKMLNESNVFQELSAYGFPLDLLKKGTQTVLLTVHRRENIGSHMINICRAVKHLARTCQDILFVWVLHKNPYVRRLILSEMEGKSENIAMIEPVSYETLVYFMKRSYLMMTDSGGIQEEAPTFGKPVIVLRESTERPEIIEQGIGFSAGKGVTRQKIIDIFLELYNDKKLYNSIAKKENPFGDGSASQRILQLFSLDSVRDFIKDYPRSSDQILDTRSIEGFQFEKCVNRTN